MPRRDKRRPALLARDVFADEKRWKARRDGLDPDQPRGGVCVRIDLKTGERVEIIELGTGVSESGVKARTN